MSHVERIVEVALVAKHHTGGRLGSVIQDAHLVDAVQRPCLGRDVGRGEHEAAVQVVRLRKVHKFGHNLTVHLLVKLVHQHTVEAGDLANDADSDVQERLNVTCGAELPVDLVEERKDVERRVAVCPRKVGARTATWVHQFPGP